MSMRVNLTAMGCMTYVPASRLILRRKASFLSCSTVPLLKTWFFIDQRAQTCWIQCFGTWKGCEQKLRASLDSLSYFFSSEESYVSAMYLPIVLEDMPVGNLAGLLSIALKFYNSLVSLNSNVLSESIKHGIDLSRLQAYYCIKNICWNKKESLIKKYVAAQEEL